MSIAKMTGVSIAFTLGGALVGGAIGWAMGTYIPGFYRATVPYFDDEGQQTSAVEIGLGFGIAQGLLMGFILACVILIASAIRYRRAD
jgi:hypothetical protein